MADEKIFVGVAWPYANGEQHIGHIAGAYLPPDIFSRYHRLCGRDVVMVSGSDAHGTPVSLSAKAEDVSEEEIFKKYHDLFIESYIKLGLNFDLFTTTHTEIHTNTAQDFFTSIATQGYLYKDTSKQLYDCDEQQFLPDRYVEGICPFCGTAEARGDQCDQCGKTYDSWELKEPVSKISGSRNIEVKETEHFYIDLKKLEEPLIEWMSDGKEHWRKHVLNLTKAELQKRQLRGRPVTRDISWGVKVPVAGYDDKSIYVWFEAVIGYYSACLELAKISGNVNLIKDFWAKESSVQSYYFIGKDNIFFHATLWPAMLMAKGGLQLPYDVPANQYLNLSGKKFSKSRGTSIAVADVLSRYQADAWRYALTAMAPESADVDFSWEEFVEKVNHELVANWGNLVNRVLGFAYKKFEQKIPTPAALTNRDKKLLGEIESGFVSVGKLYAAVQLRAALEDCRRLSALVNQYLNDEPFWTIFKQDVSRAQTILFVSLQCIQWLALMWAPVLPAASQKIWSALGFKENLFGELYKETVSDQLGSHSILRYRRRADYKNVFVAEPLPVGQLMEKPEAPFTKLDLEVVLAEEAAASAQH